MGQSCPESVESPTATSIIIRQQALEPVNQPALIISLLLKKRKKLGHCDHYDLPKIHNRLKLQCFRMELDPVLHVDPFMNLHVRRGVGDRCLHN